MSSRNRQLAHLPKQTHHRLSTQGQNPSELVHDEAAKLLRVANSCCTRNGEARPPQSQRD